MKFEYMLIELLIQMLIYHVNQLIEYNLRNIFLEKSCTKVNFKIYDVINWETNNYITHIANILRSKGNQQMKFEYMLIELLIQMLIYHVNQLIEYNLRNIFLEKSCTN